MSKKCTGTEHVRIYCKQSVGQYQMLVDLRVMSEIVRMYVRGKVENNFPETSPVLPSGAFSQARAPIAASATTTSTRASARLRRTSRASATQGPRALGSAPATCHGGRVWKWLVYGKQPAKLINGRLAWLFRAPFKGSTVGY